MKNVVYKYIWILPSLYVAYEFGVKLFEVLADKQEFVDIISVIHPLAPFATTLAYSVGIFDFIVALTLISIAMFPLTKKYSTYIFTWVILWPFIPASVRYFGGVSDFELQQVLLISFSALLSYILYYKFNKNTFKIS